MTNSFNVEVACECGVYAAIFLQEIYFWCIKNESESVNFIDGKYWTYNSLEAYLEKYPYISSRQLRTAIERLKEADLIVTGNYNRSTFNRTVWYSVTEKAKSILGQNEQIENDDPTNGRCQNAIFQNVKTTNGVVKTVTSICTEQHDPFDQNDKSYNVYNNYTQNTDSNTDGDTDSNTDSNTDSDTDIYIQKRPRKKKYGEYKHVMLTDAELERLIRDYGDAETKAAIKYLDEYIEEKGYKAKSHNLTMRRWVFDAVKKRHKRVQRDYDWESLERSLSDDG